MTRGGEEIAPIYRCQTHKEQVLSQFCVDCDKKLCNLCIATDVSHAEHKVKAVEELLAEMRSKINSSLSSIP